MMTNETIRLFKAIPITTKVKGTATEKFLKLTIERGFVFSPEVLGNYTEHELMPYVVAVEKSFGLTKERMNATFHKSWNKVKTAPMEQLVVEQLIHYFTTYGFERLGIYNENNVYIPKEDLNIPQLEDRIKLIVIRGLTKEEIKQSLTSILNSGIALKEDTIKDIVVVANFVELTQKDIEQIKNKEVKCIMFDKLNTIPSDAVEFLRFLIYKSTKKTLIIKDKATIRAIQTSDDNLLAYSYFNKYNTQYGLKPLAQIFNRFKPLFLAYKKQTELKPIINKIAKLSKTYHEAMDIDYLNDVTNLMKTNQFNFTILEAHLERANVFRKIRLAYALHYRMKNDTNSIMYQIRNGKSYAKSFTPTKSFTPDITNNVYENVIESIVESIKRNVKGKRVYIPSNIEYTLPATEKQFVGNFPAGTYITLPHDMIFGVNWENIGEHRIDLDLSTISTNGKIGWDTNYRNGSGSVLFSGDITYAPKPNGATELFYIKQQNEDSFLVLLNYFNHIASVNVPYKIVIGTEKLNSLTHNHMLNPNNVVCVAQTNIKDKQKIIGLVTTNMDECRYYFLDTTIGNSITSGGHNEYIKQGREYLTNYYKDMISLKTLLIRAGARVVDAPKNADIDLSIKSLTKDTILKLLL